MGTLWSRDELAGTPILLLLFEPLPPLPAPVIDDNSSLMKAVVENLVNNMRISEQKNS